MKISVVVPVYNGSKTLAECLESVLKCNDPDFEVIVVDDCSSDSSQEIVAQYPSIKLVRLPERSGAGSARSAGVSLAEGEIIAFTDSDCIVPPDWLASMRRELTPDIGGVCGLYRVDRRQNFMGRFATYDFFNIWFRWLPRTPDHLATGNCAYWKKYIQQVNQDYVNKVFKNMAAGEDALLGLLVSRIKPLKFTPDLYIIHQSPDIFRSYFRQQMVRGYSRTILSFLHFRDKVLGPRDISLGNVFMQLSTVGLTLLGLIIMPFHRYGFYLFLISFLSFLVLEAKPLQFIYNEEKKIFSIIQSIPLIFLRNTAWMVGAVKGLYYLITHNHKNNDTFPENN